MNQASKSRPEEDVLEESVLHALLEAAPAVDIPDVVNARLRQKVMGITQSASSNTAALRTVRSAEGEWVNIAPNVDIKILSDDAAYRTLLYRFGPGGKLPPHDHRGDEECIVLEGELHLGDIHVKRGDYHLAPRGSAHAELFSETGALIYVRHARAPRNGLSQHVS